MELGSEEREGGRGGEKEGWMMTLSAVYIASLVGAVWMALDYLLFKQRQRMHLVQGWEKETWVAENGAGGGVRDTQSKHRHAAVPRNPSSKRGTASLSPWL